jgi:hypothetical protein
MELATPPGRGLYAPFCPVSALKRVEHLDLAGSASVAALALPVTSETNMSVQLDPVRQSWIVSWDNPNLRVLGPQAPLPARPVERLYSVSGWVSAPPTSR